MAPLSGMTRLDRARCHDEVGTCASPRPKAGNHKRYRQLPLQDFQERLGFRRRKGRGALQCLSAPYRRARIPAPAANRSWPASPCRAARAAGRTPRPSVQGCRVPSWSRSPGRRRPTTVPPSRGCRSWRRPSAESCLRFAVSRNRRWGACPASAADRDRCSGFHALQTALAGRHDTVPGDVVGIN